MSCTYCTLLGPPSRSDEELSYRMFEENMDEYLDEEIESLRNALELICRGWDNKVSEVFRASRQFRFTFPQISKHASSIVDQARFLSSHNPAQVKRNVLASFTDVLLLPVTIVPKTVGMTVGAMGAAAGAAGSAAVQGLQMLNPQRWAGNNAIPDGYSQRFDAGDTLFDVGGDDDDDDYVSTPVPTRPPSRTQDTISGQRTGSDVPLPLSYLTGAPLQPRTLHNSLLLQIPPGKH